MRKIKLTQGKYALVDGCDYEFLMQWKWFANRVGNTFYAIRSKKIDGKWKTIYMHRVVAERMGLALSGDIHHERRNGLNNQRRNLFDLTRKQHMEKGGLRRDNTSGVKGVCFDKCRDKWMAYIYHNGKHIFIGRFDTKRQAIKARKAAEKKYFTHA